MMVQELEENQVLKIQIVVPLHISILEVYSSYVPLKNSKCGSKRSLRSISYKIYTSIV